MTPKNERKGKLRKNHLAKTHCQSAAYAKQQPTTPPKMHQQKPTRNKDTFALNSAGVMSQSYTDNMPISTSPFRNCCGNPVFQMWDLRFHPTGRFFLNLVLMVGSLIAPFQTYYKARAGIKQKSRPRPAIRNANIARIPRGEGWRQGQDKNDTLTCILYMTAGCSTPPPPRARGIRLLCGVVWCHK